MSFDFLIPILISADNYSYLLKYDQNALVIDPTQADPIIEVLKKEDLTLQAILCTHHHSDHIDGAYLLKEKYHAKIFGPMDKRIDCLDEGLKDQDLLNLSPFQFKIIATPGHTKSHIIFYETNYKILFSGDTLFGAGCGRVFEGSYEQMYNSLQKLMKLDDDTYIYFGHEYTLKNLQFAHQILPEDKHILQRLEKTKHLRKNHQFTVPSTMKEEKQTNLFLRVGDSKLKNALQMKDQPEVDVFAKLRKLRDNF